MHLVDLQQVAFVRPKISVDSRTNQLPSQIMWRGGADFSQDGNVR